MKIVSVFKWFGLLGVFLGLAQTGNACEQGLYLRGDWLASQPHLERVQGKHYRDLYIYLNEIGVANLKAPKIQANLKILEQAFPQARVQGWLGLRVCDSTHPKNCVHLDSKTEVERIQGQAQKIWAAGFSGVHLDLEPISSGDLRLLAVLQALQIVKPRGKLLSIAGMSLAPEGDILKVIHPRPKHGASVYTWTKEYYKLLLPALDQVMVMNYDTALEDRREYELFTSWQTQQFTDIFQSSPQNLPLPSSQTLSQTSSQSLSQASHPTSRVELRMGIPVYQQGRPGVFHPQAENFESAMRGIQTVWQKQRCPEKMGMAVFIEDEFKKADQEVFGREW